MSPAANTLSTLVRMNSSTTMPFSVSSDVSSTSSVLKFRPMATPAKSHS